MPFERSIYGLGLLSAAYIFFKIFQFAYLFLRPSSLWRYKRGTESWAFITGASDGIGLAFAQVLCHHGFNVILLGHKPEELKDAKVALQRQSPKVKVQILVIDAISSSPLDLENAIASVKHLNITILINNVGGLPVMSSYFKTLVEYTAEEIDDTIYLNARFLARITRLLFGDFARNGPSLIMNISSAGQIGVPYQVMYSATKGFVSTFSASLSTEALAEGLPIEVISIIPGHVRSGSHKVPISWFTPAAPTFAKAALDRIGCGQLVVPGYWRHALQIYLLESFPIWVRQKLLIMDMKETIALSKKEV